MAKSIADRPNNARHPMTAAEARGVIIEMEAQVRSASKRKRMALFFSGNAAGRLSGEAIEVYRHYAQTGSL